MNPSLYRKLIEQKHITTNTQLAVELHTYQDLKKTGTVKGLFTVVRLFADALLPGTFLEVTNGTDSHIIQPDNIKLIEGKTAVKLAAEFGIRADGNTNDAPKRRGRKPKVRVVEQEWSLGEDGELAEDDEELDDDLEDDEVEDELEATA